MAVDFCFLNYSDLIITDLIMLNQQMKQNIIKI